MTGAAIREAAFTPATAIAAPHLPGTIHGDPVDRILVATARHLNIPLVTSDAKITAYARQGFVSVLPC